LGNLDEINSYLGLCKVKAFECNLPLPGKSKLAGPFIHELQEGLFQAQAELAGAKMHVSKRRVTQVEKMVDAIEKELPPIKSFFISGGTELGSLFDFARTIARRAERRVVAVKDAGDRVIDKDTLSYLNRLSSILYALARWSNFRAGIKEQAPSYK